MTSHTLPLPSSPANPKEFCQLMELIWADVGEVTDDGLILYQTIWNEEWGNAHTVARHIELRRTGGTELMGDDGTLYRFPDGAGLWVRGDGAGCAPHGRPYSPRRTRPRVAKTVPTMASI